MLLPDLLPDLRFPLLPKDEEAFRQSFEIKRAAMAPYIVQRWGWNEALQLRLHHERFTEKPFSAIDWCERRVGTLSLMTLRSHIRFGEFYLLPEVQRQGLGSRILCHCLALADAKGLPVRLEYLKWNPVGTLYRRHGFEITGESDIHWFMERSPAPP
jgi:GNAT superfamily N-acetyltransferase